MRAIKFRGKRISNGQWEYGYYDVDSRGDAFIRHPNIYNPNFIDVYQIDPDSVCQFIGLYDKNKKEIYEGDILHWHTLNLFVKWLQDDCKYILVGCHDKDYCLNAYKCNIEDEFEVIGNVFDNEELLKTL